ncbi:MAG: hypothetical protein M1385_02630 [Candidatus Marsarchaeota archaeon]|nr:hypothetical protein [Candidatus Marsarchaeota archaeon]
MEISERRHLINSYKLMQDYLGHERGSRFMFLNMPILERHHKRVDPILNILKKYMGRESIAFVESNPLIFLMDHNLMEANFEKIHKSIGRSKGNKLILKYPFILEYNHKDIAIIVKHPIQLRRKG